jgi:hypothetical protein
MLLQKITPALGTRRSGPSPLLYQNKGKRESLDLRATITLNREGWSGRVTQGTVIYGLLSVRTFCLPHEPSYIALRLCKLTEVWSQGSISGPPLAPTSSLNNK